VSLGAIWRWIDRDLNQVRPISALFIILPFIPFAIALEVTTDEAAQDNFLMGGLFVALPWFLYVTWRGMKVVTRSFKDTAAYFSDLPLSPAQRRWRLVQGALAMIAVGGFLIYVRY
jgi:hypothetical protein